MLEKTLHAGNIAANFGVVATAADLTFCGGAATTIGAALSTTALFKSLGKRDKSLAQTMADAMQKEFDAQNLQGDRKILVAQVLGKAKLTEDDLIDGNLTASTIAKNLRNRIHDETEDPEIKSASTLDPFEDIVFETLQAVLAADATTAATQGAVNRELLTGQDEIKTLILNYFEQSGEAQSARESGVTDAQIIALAQEVAEDISDPNEAFRELEAAVEDAKAFRERAARGSNLDTVVGDLLKRLQALVDDGKLKEAQTEASDTLARWEADEAARAERAKLTHIELIDTALDRDLAVRDAESAAKRIVQKADLEAGEQAGFQVIRDLTREWKDRGREKSTRLDLEIAKELTRLNASRPTDNVERGMSFDDIGNALYCLGELEVSNRSLDEALLALKEALAVWSQHGTGDRRAQTQNAMGSVLVELGERLNDPARILEGIEAYQTSLLYWTRQKAPLDWAMAQSNLCNAKMRLGTFQGDEQMMREAVSGYKSVLEVWTRDALPRDWAMVQHNLGTALGAIGDFRADNELRKESVAAFRLAIEERPKKSYPVEWASSQIGLADVLGDLAKNEPNGFLREIHMKSAIAAYKEVLSVRTRKKTPLDWAHTHHNLGCSLIDLAHITGKVEDIRAAIDSFRKSLAVWTQSATPSDWSGTQNSLGVALRFLGTKEANVEFLFEANEAYKRALQARSAKSSPMLWGATQTNLANLHVSIFDLTWNAAHLDQSEEHLANAREVFEEAGAIGNLQVLEGVASSLKARRASLDP